MAGQVKLTLLITSVLKGKDAYKQTQQGLQGVGKGAGFAATAMKALAAVGISAFFVSSIKKAAEFSDTMAAVQAATGATEDQFKALGDEAKRIGAEFGRFTATEAAEGMRVLSFAGFSVEETLTAIEPVMKLSQAGMLDLGEAANAVAGSLRSFGFNASETERVVDVMTKTFISSNTGMQQLSDAIRFVGPIAAQAGISFEEMNATLGVLANSAIKGGQAGTNLRNILIRLQAPSDDARKTLAELGVSIFQLPAAAQAAERALNADFRELQQLESQMADTSAASKELQGSLNELNVQEAKNNLEISKIRENTASQARELAKEEAENNLELARIRDEVADRGTKITEDEVQNISKLEAANRDLSIARTELALQQESNIEGLVVANEGLAISQAELSIQQDEMRVKEEALKDSIANTESSIKTNSEAFDSAKGPLKSMAELATEFNVAMDGLSKAQQTEALATIFGSRNIAAFQIIMRSMSDEVGEGQQTLEDYTQTLRDSGGTADEINAIMEDGLGNTLATVSSAFEALQLQLVDDFEPELREMFTILKEDLIPALGEMIPVISNIVKIAILFIDILTPLITMLAETPGLIEAIVIALIAWKIVQIAVNIAMMANPIGLIITLIVLLIIAVWLIVANWDEVSAALMIIWEGLKDAFFAVVGVLTSAFTSLGDTITGIFDSIRDTIMGVWETITGFIDMITGLPDTVSSSIGDLTGGLGINLPSFEGGGIVPGPLGSPQLIVAHGGEPFGDAAGQDGGGGNSITSNDTINLNVNVSGAMDEVSVDAMSTLLAEQVIEKKRRADHQLLREGT